MTIEKVAREELQDILQLQYRAYASEARLLNNWNIPPLKQTLAEVEAEWDKGVLLKAVEDGKLLGSVRAWEMDGTVYVGKLMVEPEFQGRGIGTKLYTALEKILDLQGYHILYALVTEENTESIAFHEKFSYKKQAFFPDCGWKFGRWLGVFWMEKRLNSVEIPTSFPTSWRSIGQKGEKSTDILAILSLS